MALVKITKEQMQAIEGLRRLGCTNKQMVKYNFELLEIDKDTMAKTIHNMDFDTLIKALYTGYERS